MRSSATFTFGPAFLIRSCSLATARAASNTILLWGSVAFSIAEPSIPGASRGRLAASSISFCRRASTALAALIASSCVTDPRCRSIRRYAASLSMASTYLAASSVESRITSFLGTSVKSPLRNVSTDSTKSASAARRSCSALSPRILAIPGSTASGAGAVTGDVATMLLTKRSSVWVGALSCAVCCKRCSSLILPSISSSLFPLGVMRPLATCSPCWDKSLDCAERVAIRADTMGNACCACSGWLRSYFWDTSSPRYLLTSGVMRPSSMCFCALLLSSITGVARLCACARSAAEIFSPSCCVSLPDTMFPKSSVISPRSLASFSAAALASAIVFWCVAISCGSSPCICCCTGAVLAASSCGRRLATDFP